MSWSFAENVLSIQFDALWTTAVALLLLIVGYGLRRRLRFFETFWIPALVVGGLLMAVLALVLHHNGGASVRFTTSLQSPMMLAFFTTVGIGGSFSSPKITLDVKNAVKDAVSNAIGEKLGLSVGSSEGKSADEIRADAKAKGDKLVEEARAQRDKLVGKASGKLARIAAQASGDALVSAAEKQAQKLMEQAEQQIAAQQ